MLFGLMIVLSAVSAVAQIPSSCSANQPTCNELGGEGQREQIEPEDLTSLAAANVQIIRIYTADGFGNRFAPISYVRRPRQEPVIEITNGISGFVTQTPIPVESWDQALLESSTFDAPPVPPQADGPLPLPCLHPWSARIEVIDRPHQNSAFRVRSRTQTQCQGGSTYSTALLLLAQAKKLVPACSILHENSFNSTSSLLTFCSSMDGDRAAVAEAHNVFAGDWLQSPRNESYGGFLAHYFYDQAQFKWLNNPPVLGMSEVADQWAVRFSHSHIAPKRWTGINDHEVYVTGAVYVDGNTAGKPLVFNMQMIKENGFDFRIRSVTIKEQD